MDDGSTSRVAEGDDPSEEGAGPAGFRMPSESRIRKGTEIRHILGRGKRKRTQHVDVFFAASPVLRCRFGQVVPKHRHDLVDRNRLRRRLREIGRREILPRLWAAGAPVDVLVRARPPAYEATFDELRDEIVTATEEICSERSSSA